VILTPSCNTRFPVPIKIRLNVGDVTMPSGVPSCGPSDSLWPGVIVVPSMSTGATDGKALRAVGIKTYGVSGLFGERGDVRAHRKDERTLASSFYQAQLFLYDLVKALSV
jgi:hypothetical protein